MAGEHENFALGEDVTGLARSKSGKGTMVVSVRLSVLEFAAVEALSRERGKIPSQIVREAISDYLHASRSSQPTITISVESGTTLATGVPQVHAKASTAVTRTQQEMVPA